MADETGAAFEAEVAAHRKALDAYTTTFLEELGEGGWLGGLAGTSHRHRTFAVGNDGKAIMLTIRIEFGDVIAADELQELVAMAKRDPGSVPEA